MDENVPFTSEAPAAHNDEPGGRGTGVAGEADPPGKAGGTSQGNQWHARCISAIQKTSVDSTAAERGTSRCGRGDAAGTVRPWCHLGRQMGSTPEFEQSWVHRTCSESGKDPGPPGLWELLLLRLALAPLSREVLSLQGWGEGTRHCLHK